MRFHIAFLVVLLGAVVANGSPMITSVTVNQYTAAFPTASWWIQAEAGGTSVKALGDGPANTHTASQAHTWVYGSGANLNPTSITYVGGALSDSVATDTLPIYRPDHPFDSVWYCLFATAAFPGNSMTLTGTFDGTQIPTTTVTGPNQFVGFKVTNISDIANWSFTGNIQMQDPGGIPSSDNELNLNVLGVSAPEPSSAALIVLASVSLLNRSRRFRRPCQFPNRV